MWKCKRSLRRGRLLRWNVFDSREETGYFSLLYLRRFSCSFFTDCIDRLCCIVLHFSVLYFTVFYYTSTTVYCTTIHCTLLYYTIQCPLLYYTMLLRLILLMWRIGRAPNSIPIYEYIQQDATLHSLFIYGNCSTCFRWYFHPSSGAHTTVSTACPANLILLPFYQADNKRRKHLQFNLLAPEFYI
jgi:hypothetical protein